jgi:hypothetical protein
MKSFFYGVWCIAFICVATLYITHEYQEHVHYTTVEPECAKMVTRQSESDGITRDLKQYCSIEE